MKTIYPPGTVKVNLDGLKLSLVCDVTTIQTDLSPDRALSRAALLIFHARDEIYIRDSKREAVGAESQK